MADHRDDGPHGALARILVASDFSPTAALGLRWGVALASAHGARLHLVHAIQPLAPSLAVGPLAEELRGAALGRLETVAEAVEASVPVTCAAEHGSSWEVICEAARAWPADLIVVGTRGLTGLEHLILGSTAERVIQRAPCPVLSVHPGDTAVTAAPPDVLVPTALSGGAFEAGRAALRVFGGPGGPPRIRLVHVFHVPEELEIYGGRGTTSYAAKVSAALQALCLDRLEPAAEQLRELGTEVEATLLRGYPVDVILERAASCQVIAMATRRRSGLKGFFLGSVAARVVQLASRPVLTVAQGQTERDWTATDRHVAPPSPREA